MSTPTLHDIRAGIGNDPKLVQYLQAALISQGYRVGTVGLYDPATQNAVRDFQASRLGPDGKFLEPDGWVGKKTWWAILNPSGPPQKSNLDARIPKGLSADRRAVLQAFWTDHKAGVREIPDGSNWGGGVERYLKGIGPAYWCAYAVSTWVKDGTGRYPFDERVGACRKLWSLAQKAGRAYATDKTPVPGDAFVILYRNSRGQLTGEGHTGLVVATAMSGDAFNTGEGNAGNRVKAGTRQCSAPLLVGFVDFYGDRDTVVGKFARGLLDVKDTVTSDRSSTR